MLNAKDNRNSQVFESLALLDQPAQPAVSDKERKKFEDEKSKLYMQMDEKVSSEKKKTKKKTFFCLSFLTVNPKHILARRTYALVLGLILGLGASNRDVTVASRS